METCSSGEDLLVKARKPYTITKQRERWTDEEHDRFLEAVRLYGRAWQKIEEHVGTKTAIQIRSHAQKFFTKLEKEALSKGLPLGQAHDIDIPPPRPKRKPNNPYPRKTCIAPKLTSGESIFSQYQISLSEKDASLKDSTMNASCGRVKEIAENSQSSGVFTVMKDAPCTSASSSKGLVSLHLTGEMLPMRNEIHQGSVQKKTSIDENHIAEILIDRDIEVNTCTKEGKCENIVGKTFSDKPVDKNKEEKIGKSPENPAQIAQSYPSLFPMPVNGNSNEKYGLDASADPANCTPIPLQAAHGSSNLFAVPSFAALMPTIHGISSFPSCTPFQNNQDGFKFFNDISPSFSDLIVSTLQQNPAVHAAARLAASNWPCSNGNTSLHYSESGSGGTSESSVKNSPSIAAIASATVAAATAWWAIHGLLPFCHPFPVGFSFAPLSMMSNAVPESNRSADRKETKAEASFKVPNTQLCDGQIHCHSTNLSPRQSSDTDESEKHKDTNDISVKVPAGKKSSSVEVAGCHDPNSKAKLKKKQYRSSCGSNTPSSSDETEITPEKTNKGMEEVKDMQGHLLNSESINRHSRGCINVNESWKEVSEEGRLAFQALFSREVLPQSFSPPSEDEVATESDKNNEGDTPFINLNSKKPWIDDKHDSVQGSENTLLKIASQSTNCFSLGHSDQVKLKNRRTGFKPYKRCFLESRENMTNGEENNAKRIRIEDDASN